MQELADSVVVEWKHKRLPTRKSGRMLVCVREHLSGEIKNETKARKFHVPTDKIVKLKRLDARISGYLIREDKKRVVQLNLMDELYTKDLTTVVFKVRVNYWVRMKADYTGGIEETKAALKLAYKRNRVIIEYLHYRKSEKPLTRNMWFDYKPF